MMLAGKKVVDAKKPLILEIRQSDIEKSDRKKPDNCAAAVACKRQLHVKDVRIHLSKVYVDVGDRWERYDTPTSLSREAIAFDKGGKFEPGEHKLNRPKPSHRLGAEKRANRGPKPTGKKSRSYVHATNVRASAFDNVWKK